MVKQRLPGDLTPQAEVERMIRVDQAGEYGAKRIYQGQLAVLKGRAGEASIRHMAEQEQRHLDTFDRLMATRRVRPTLLGPIWHAAGFALGAATALLGEKAAMACTEAVEEVIDEHYAAQTEALEGRDAELGAAIAEAHADEIEHRDAARAAGAAEAPAYPVLKEVIKRASRTAIWLSERV